MPPRRRRGGRKVSTDDNADNADNVDIADNADIADSSVSSYFLNGFALQDGEIPRPDSSVSLYFLNGFAKRERSNTQGRAFSADRFTAKHLPMLGLFGVLLSTRRAKRDKKGF